MILVRLFARQARLCIPALNASVRSNRHNNAKNLENIPSTSATCREKNVSSMRMLITSSSFRWRSGGLAPDHSDVILLLSCPCSNLRGALVWWAASPELASALSTSLRLSDELAWPSREANFGLINLVGEFRVDGIASSSVVCPRVRLDSSVSVKFRTVIPYKCLSLWCFARNQGVCNNLDLMIIIQSSPWTMATVAQCMN